LGEGQRELEGRIQEEAKARDAIQRRRGRVVRDVRRRCRESWASGEPRTMVPGVDRRIIPPKARIATT
jgi:hypothetical protein